MITTYKDLQVWEKADQLAHKVFDLTDQFPKEYLYDLTNQLRRAALSVPTNIVEGCASLHTKEFIQFLNISRRSLYETRYLLDFAFRRGLIKSQVAEDLTVILDETGKMTNALIRALRLKSKHQTLNTKH